MKKKVLPLLLVFLLLLGGNVLASGNSYFVDAFGSRIEYTLTGSGNSYTAKTSGGITGSGGSDISAITSMVDSYRKNVEIPKALEQGNLELADRLGSTLDGPPIENLDEVNELVNSGFTWVLEALSVFLGLGVLVSIGGFYYSNLRVLTDTKNAYRKETYMKMVGNAVFGIVVGGFLIAPPTRRMILSIAFDTFTDLNNPVANISVLGIKLGDKITAFTVILGAILLLTGILRMILDFIGLGMNASNPQSRSKSLMGILKTGLIITLAGSGTLIVGLLYNAFG